MESASYTALIENAKQCISARAFDAAAEHAAMALALDPSRPEAFNVLGAASELRGDWSKAQGFYRAALGIAPAYKPALANLMRTASCWNKDRKIVLEDGG